MKVYNDLMKENVLSYGDCSFIKGIADYIAKQNLPSASQCKRLVKIVNKAEDEGYIMPNKKKTFYGTRNKHKRPA